MDEGAVVLAPQRTSRGWTDAPDARLVARSGELRLNGDSLLTGSDRATWYPAAGALVLHGARGPLIVRSDEWGDGDPVVLPFAPSWAPIMAGILGAGALKHSEDPLPEGVLVAADPSARPRTGWQITYAVLALGSIPAVALADVQRLLHDGDPTWSDSVFRATQFVVLVVAAAVAAVWARGSARLRRPLPGQLLTGPGRVRLATDDDALTLRDRDGSELRLPRQTALGELQWTQGAGDVVLLRSDGPLVLRLPLVVWGPDLTGAMTAAKLERSTRSGRRAAGERCIPAAHPPELYGEPGLPGTAWVTMTGILLLFSGVVGVQAPTTTTRFLGIAELAALVVLSTVGALGRRRSTASGG